MLMIQEEIGWHVHILTIRHFLLGTIAIHNTTAGRIGAVYWSPIDPLAHRQDGFNNRMVFTDPIKYGLSKPATVDANDYWLVLSEPKMGLVDVIPELFRFVYKY